MDDVDYPLVSPFKWYAARYGRLVYAQREVRRTDGSRTTVKLHQLISSFDMTDHKDGDGLNCRRNNLRPSTSLQNGANKRKPIRKLKTASQYKGVAWREESKVWRAMIRVNWKLIHLGQFEKEIEAARAYDTAAKKYFGDFAAPNFNI